MLVGNSAVGGAGFVINLLLPDPQQAGPWRRSGRANSHNTILSTSPLHPQHAHGPRTPVAITLARCFVAAAVVSYLANLYPQTLDHLTDGNGPPFGDVFVNSWSAAYLTLHRRLAEIYDVNAFYAFEQSVVRPAVSGYHYSYPSVMLLISAPLSLIPYLLALFVWLTTSWYTFYRVLKGTLPEGDALVFSLATPAVLVNAVGGQNNDGNRGFCRRRPHSPRLAGGLLGLMI
jgi:arabinofuranan 3-O-arabinosyltransferase